MSTADVVQYIAEPIAAGAVTLTPAALVQNAHGDLNAALSAIPDGHTGAFLLDGTATDVFGKPSVQALVVQKISGNWAVMATCSWDGHHVAEKVSIGGSW